MHTHSPCSTSPKRQLLYLKSMSYILPGRSCEHKNVFVMNYVPSQRVSTKNSTSIMQYGITPTHILCKLEVEKKRWRKKINKTKQMQHNTRNSSKIASFIENISMCVSQHCHCVDAYISIAAKQSFINNLLRIVDRYQNK